MKRSPFQPSLYDVLTMGSTFAAGVSVGRGEPVDLSTLALGLGPLAAKTALVGSILARRPQIYQRLEADYHRKIADNPVEGLVERAAWDTSAAKKVLTGQREALIDYSSEAVGRTAYFTGAAFTTGVVLGYLTK